MSDSFDQARPFARIAIAGQGAARPGGLSASPARLFARCYLFGGDGERGSQPTEDGQGEYQDRCLPGGGVIRFFREAEVDEGFPIGPAGSQVDIGGGVNLDLLHGDAFSVVGGSPTVADGAGERHAPGSGGAA